MRIILAILCFGLGVNLFAATINFDFIDARKKGYTDKEILDYVSKNINGYDIAGIRRAGLSDKEIVDFFIQKDSVGLELKELSKKTFKDTKSEKSGRVYPFEVSSDLALGCKIYTGKVKQADGWFYTTKLTDFAIAAYTSAYLNEKNYFNIDKSESVSLKNICSIWLDKLKTNDEIRKAYALSLVVEINKLVKQNKALIID